MISDRDLEIQVRAPEKTVLDPRTIRPNRDFVLVLQDKRKSVLSCGLIIPMETNHEKLHEGSGTLIRVGQGHKAEKLELHEGDRVMYRTYLRHANKLQIEETWEDGEKKEYALISIDDLVAVLDSTVEIGLLSEKTR